VIPKLREVIPRLEGLSAVTSLLLNPRHERLSEHSWASLRSNFRMLVKLDMLNADFDSFADAVDLIYSFPSLEILVLSGNWNNYLPPTSYQPHLHTLKLSCPTKDVLEWILSLDPVPIVLTLRLDYISLSQMPCIDQYLKILGSGLQHLTLYFGPATSGEATEGSYLIKTLPHSQ